LTPSSVAASRRRFFAAGGADPDDLMVLRATPPAARAAGSQRALAVGVVRPAEAAQTAGPWWNAGYCHRQKQDLTASATISPRRQTGGE